MSKIPDDKAERPDRKQVQLAREAAALRANLLKRKDQARRRQEKARKPDR